HEVRPQACVWLVRLRRQQVHALHHRGGYAVVDGGRVHPAPAGLLRRHQPPGVPEGEVGGVPLSLMNTQTTATRFCSLVASVVATVVIGGAVTKADAGAAGGHHSHAASATQPELLEQYSKLVAALDTMAATHDPATVDAAIVSGRPVLLAFLDRGCVECLRMISVVAQLHKDLDKPV